ncbi:MAG: hypothetical protein M1821_007217 [Bathelium mastoideum]|nr:MAG: hypothetical protein M1821_007217 [Bathelium mastoideum]
MQQLPSIDDLLKDPFEALRESSDDIYDTMGLTCELRSKEARYNSKGERVVYHAGQRRDLEALGDTYPESALVLTKYYNKEGDLQYTEMDVRSPHIRQALREAVKDYGGVNLQGRRIILRDFDKCLFHYEKELREYGRLANDYEASRHIDFALQYLIRTLETEMRSFFINVKINAIPRCDFANLWMVFRPGALLYMSQKPRAEALFKLKSFELWSSLVSSRQRWDLEMWRISCDGDFFGYQSTDAYIDKYEGYRSLQELPIVPLDYHEKKQDIAARALSRGRRYIGFCRQHHCEYKGIADRTMGTESDEEPLVERVPVEVTGRIVVDPSRFTALTYSEIVFSMHRYRIADNEQIKLSDEELQICDNQVAGFSLLRKEWCFFDLDKITDVIYDANAFNHLLLDESKKNMIKSLIMVREESSDSFDDLIKGKGKGLVFLLHGPTGVGKTLTAESLAEFAKRPLYILTSGDLDVDSANLEKNLRKAMELVTRWNAILLIDEADVFLQARDLDNIRRNGLVSVFLRVLEYFEGIMILTTNRVQTFDYAFKSRIHLALEYPVLSKESRGQLWRLFISKASPGKQDNWIDEAHMDSLSSYPFNGREIKNVVRTAIALSMGQKTEFGVQHLNQAAEMVAQFNASFGTEQSQRVADSGSPRIVPSERLEGQDDENDDEDNDDDHRPRKRLRTY